MSNKPSKTILQVSKKRSSSQVQKAKPQIMKKQKKEVDTESEVSSDSEHNSTSSTSSGNSRQGNAELATSNELKHISVGVTNELEALAWRISLLEKQTEEMKVDLARVQERKSTATSWKNSTQSKPKKASTTQAPSKQAWGLAKNGEHGGEYFSYLKTDDGSKFGKTVYGSMKWHSPEDLNIVIKDATSKDGTRYRVETIDDIWVNGTYEVLDDNLI